MFVYPIPGHSQLKWGRVTSQMISDFITKLCRLHHI